MRDSVCPAFYTSIFYLTIHIPLSLALLSQILSLTILIALAEPEWLACMTVLAAVCFLLNTYWHLEFLDGPSGVLPNHVRLKTWGIDGVA